MEKQHEQHKQDKMMYKKFALMIVLSFIAMYVLMYSMVDKFSNALPNINQFYMAGLMTMPMVILEIVIMGGMYMNKKLNKGILAIGFILMVVFFLGIRKQAAVGDRQFLRSMIPHHAAAILMVEKASLNNPEIKKLAENIITSQTAEIELMKRILKEMKK